MKNIAAFFLMMLAIVASATTRDRTQVYKFRATHPCPANGSLHGACPGYVVDHIIALECGGRDIPQNMQFQTIAAAKLKDIQEHKCRIHKGKK